MPLVSGTRLGPCEVLAAIGAGGMGEVYKARDPRLGRDVAIKVLPAAFSLDADRLARFEQEARAAAALNHPDILAVYDIGQHQGAPCIASELLEGETLAELLSGSRPRAPGFRPDRPDQPSPKASAVRRSVAKAEASSLKPEARGALPVRKAIDLASQLACGLAAHRIRNVGIDLCFTAAHHVGDAVRRRRLGLESLLELVSPLHPRGIAVNQRDAMESVVLVHDVDGAPVGQTIDGQRPGLASPHDTSLTNSTSWRDMAGI